MWIMYPHSAAIMHNTTLNRIKLNYPQEYCAALIQKMITESQIYIRYLLYSISHCIISTADRILHFKYLPTKIIRKTIKQIKK